MRITATVLRFGEPKWQILLAIVAVMLAGCGVTENRNTTPLFYDGGGEPVYLHEIFSYNIYDEMAEAVAKGDFNLFKALYINSPQFINLKGRSGITLLWLAVRLQQEEIVEYLLDHGASPDVEIYWTSSIIGLAAGGDSAVLQRLLKAGASIDRESGGMDRLLPVHHAARTDRIENMKMLLVAGADVNSRTETGLFPLNLALGSRSMKMLLFLLEAGADPAMTDNRGTTVINSLIRGADPTRAIHPAATVVSMTRYTFKKEDSEISAQIFEWLKEHGYNIDELAQMEGAKKSALDLWYGWTLEEPHTAKEDK